MVNALVYYKGDEQAAAEAILLGTPIPASEVSTAASAPPPATTTMTSSNQMRAQGTPQSQPWSAAEDGQSSRGFFGNMWGRKNT